MLTSAYVTSVLDVLDIARVDPSFSGDPILGATLSVTPFHLEYAFVENGLDHFYFSNPNGVLTISIGADIFLTASVDAGMVFDPSQQAPFFAPLDDIILKTGIGSTFIDQMQGRLTNPKELSFDLFIRPDATFLIGTSGFQGSAATSADAGIAQNGHGKVPEPSSGLLLLAGIAVLMLVAPTGHPARRETVAKQSQSA